MEETYLMEHIKEVACFVSQDLGADLAAAKAGRHRCEYVLPDGLTNGKGYLRLPLTKEQLKEAAKQGKEVYPFEEFRMSKEGMQTWDFTWRA